LHIAEINSAVTTESIVTDVGAGNIESLITDMDIVLDGSDNFELRALICEACHKHAKPWIYGGALGASGAVMNILPGGGPCFRCITPDVPAPGSYPTCATAGVIGTITSVVASIQATEAIKILIGSEDVMTDYLSIDLWNNAYDSVKILRDPACPVCGKNEYALLDAGAPEDSVTALCTPGSFQVSPSSPAEIDLDAFAGRLSAIGLVMHNPYLLRFDGDGISFNLFRDGRAVIRGARDEAAARTVYSEYIGL
jgi:adenylyltransferase/sulfurtransferase